MGPDHDVHRPRLQISGDPVLVALADEAAQHLDPDREGGQATAEGQEVLLGEDGGGNEDGHLAAGFHDPEGGPQCDLGLAVAHVPAHEAVHGPLPGHVGRHLVDRALLVRRLGKWEGLGQLALPCGLRGVGEASGRLAGGIQLQQLVGQVGDRRPDPTGRGRPLPAAELAEARRRRPRIAGDAAHLVRGQEDLVGAREVELEVLADGVAVRPLRHPDVAGNAVVDVDDQLPGLQATDQVPGHDPLAGQEPPDPGDAEQLAIREEDQVRRGVAESCRARPVDDGDHSCGGGLRQPVEGTDDRRLFSQQLREPAGLVGGDHHPPPSGSQLGDPGSHPVRRAGHDRGGAEPGGVGIAPFIQRLRRLVLEGSCGTRRVVRQRPAARQLAGFHEVRAPVDRPLVGVARMGAELVRIGQHDVAVTAQVIDGRSGGQEPDPGLGRVPHVARLEAGDIGLERVAQESAIGNRVVERLGQVVRRRYDELAGGQQQDLLALRATGLGGGLEDAQGVHLVAELLDPDRVGLAGRPQVDDAAADGQLADPRHLGGRVVAGGHQRMDEVALRNAVPDPHPAPGGAQALHGQGSLPQGGERGHDHEISLRLREAGEDRQPRGRLVALGMRPFERKRAALGQDGHRILVDPRSQIVGQAMGLLIGLDHHDQWRGPRQRLTSRRQVGRTRGRRNGARRAVGGWRRKELEEGPEPRAAGHDAPGGPGGSGRSTPLNRFMVASVPSASHDSTASAAVAIASRAVSSSALVKVERT